MAVLTINLDDGNAVVSSNLVGEQLHFIESAAVNKLPGTVIQVPTAAGIANVTTSKIVSVTKA